MERIKAYASKKIIEILSKGRVPKHVAFIMDGNRRWAQSHNLPKKEGHRAGAMNLKSVLETLNDVGVEEMTVFALSVNNLKRDKDELDYLWELNRKFFNEVEGNDELWAKRKVKINVVGRIDMAPPDVQKIMYEVMDRTKDFKQFTLNICFIYCGKIEVEQAMAATYKDVKNISTGEVDLETG